MVGDAAALHRRGSRPDEYQPEARYDPENPSRRSWAEGWLALNAQPDSREAKSVELSWKPPGEQADVRLAFTDALRRLLLSLPVQADSLGLVIPDGLGPGPRETILEALGHTWEKTWFFPRTVAAALDWCSLAAKAGVVVEAGGPRSRVGTLLVVTGAADTWEVSRVPVRVGDRAPEDLCPIHDRTRAASETGFLGIAEMHGARDPALAWRSLLAFMTGDGKPAAAHASEETRDEMRRLLGCRVDASVGQPLHGLPGYQEELPSAEFIGRAGRPDRLLGVLLAGPWHEVAELPEPMRRLVGALDAPHHVAGTHAPLRGTAEGLARLRAGEVPFFEALAPVDLYYLGMNAWQDPVPEWLDLLQAQTEVPVGRVYETPEPIPGLSIPPGREPTLDLVLRVRRQGEELFYGLRERLEQDLDREMPVQISARVEPGRGLARVVVRSADDDVLNVSIREDRAEPREGPPPVVYGWPPGSAWLVSHGLLAEPARPALQSLLQRLRSGRDLISALADARDRINKWKIPGEMAPPVDPSTLEYPPEVHPLFVYLSVFPGDRRKAHPLIEPILADLEDELPRSFKAARDKRRRAAILWFASWMYARCPDALLDFVRASLSARDGATGPVLAVAGNCFHQPEDYELFFRRVDWFVRRKQIPGQYWLRAWRNLARFRHDALASKVLPTEIQERLLRAYLDMFASAPAAARGNALFLHCCYLAPHVLKRRRFDRRFLEPETEEARRFARILEQARARAQSRKHRINVSAAHDFLGRRATLATLEELSTEESA